MKDALTYAFWMTDETTFGETVSDFENEEPYSHHGIEVS